MARPTLVTLAPRPPLGSREARSSEHRAATPTRVYIETYGCQMNVADTKLIESLLGDDGYVATEQAADADVLLINTCAVREKAEDRVWARAQELAAHKKRRRDVVLGITGCMAEHLKESLHARAPYVDVICGPDSYRRLGELVAQARSGDRAACAVDVTLDKTETYEDIDLAPAGDGVSGFVTIQRGCDKFCTFCVVPFTRGRERGVRPGEILRQTREYARRGYKEITLLGQTVNSYVHEDVDFATLLRRVAAVDGIERVRFTSPYPVDFTAPVIQAIAEVPEICPHVHLPLQSGSDEVLARMRRGYTTAEFVAVVEALRSAIPDVAITTDLMTGFSGEREADHQATLLLMESLRFDSAFMFLYSVRGPTYAAKKLTDDVSEADKKRRISEVIALQERISRELYESRIGRRERVLVHAVSRRDPGKHVGRTEHFKAVVVPSDAAAIGAFCEVTIERATMATLFGRP